MIPTFKASGRFCILTDTIVKLLSFSQWSGLLFRKDCAQWRVGSHCNMLVEKHNLSLKKLERRSQKQSIRIPLTFAFLKTKFITYSLLKSSFLQTVQ